MRKIKFLCPEEQRFIESFDPCEKCEDKEICINYEYEFEMQDKELDKSQEDKKQDLNYQPILNSESASLPGEKEEVKE